jgi:hypothetical protein
MELAGFLAYDREKITTLESFIEQAPGNKQDNPNKTQYQKYKLQHGNLVERLSTIKLFV